MAKPTIVSAEEWQQARADLLKDEKEATRALDALAARRRRLPIMKFSDHYMFDTPAGPKTLADLFEGRDQLVTYQFMDSGPTSSARPAPRQWTASPTWTAWPKRGSPG